MGGIRSSLPAPNEDGILRPRMTGGTSQPQPSHDEAGANAERNDLAPNGRHRNLLTGPLLGLAPDVHDATPSPEAATRRAIEEARRRLTETGSGAGAGGNRSVFAQVQNR